jgi:hypothetical protein
MGNPNPRTIFTEGNEDNKEIIAGASLSLPSSPVNRLGWEIGIRRGTRGLDMTAVQMATDGFLDSGFGFIRAHP